MKNFCTDIQETAKIRGLTKGGQCRNKGNRTITHSITNSVSYSTETISITIGADLLNTGDEYIDREVNKELTKIFREVSPKEIDNKNTNILDTIIKQFIG